MTHAYKKDPIIDGLYPDRNVGILAIADTLNRNDRIYPKEDAASVCPTNITFALLGVGKPMAGKPMTGEVNIRMFVNPHPLSKSTRVEGSEIFFSYFDEEGERRTHTFRIHMFPQTAFDFVGAFDLLLDLEVFEDDLTEEPTLIGFTDKLQDEFKARLQSALKNPKFAQRYVHAVSLARWGVV